MLGLFGEIQISEEAHQRRQNPARFRPVEGLNGLAEFVRAQAPAYTKLANGNGSIQLRSGFSYPQFIGVCDLSRVVNQRSIAKSLIDRVLGG
jgi:hypothetical protein